MRPLGIAALALLLAGCGDSGGDDTSTSATGTTTLTGTTGSESTSEGSVSEAGSTTGVDGDPDYPKPDPVSGGGECPPGFLGPITFDQEAWVCIPECTGDPPMCPDGQTGNAVGSCATNPLSTNIPCMDNGDCMVEGEMCGNIGMDMMGCLLPPSHCVLRCAMGETCPDEMTCSANGVCQYLP